MSRKDLGRNPYGEPEEEETLGDKAANLIIYGMDKIADYVSREEQDLSYLQDGKELNDEHSDLEKVAEQTLSRDD